MSQTIIVKTALPILSALMTVLLIGCSSGDSVSKPSSGAVPSDVNARQYAPAEITTVHGNVVKGAVRHALVHFYEVNDQQIASSPVASAQTDAHGRFQVDLPSPSLSEVIYIEVVGATDGSSSMNCDVERCGPAAGAAGEDAEDLFGLGDPVPLSSEFRLSAALTDFRSSESLRISITPLTHFAVQRARSIGLTRASVRQQLSALADVFNLSSSLSHLTAVDVADPSSWSGDEPPESDSVLYGLYSSAIAQFAYAKDLTIEEAVEQLAASLYDGDGVNRELILELLGGSLAEARRAARGNPQLQRLITEVQLVINRHRCREVAQAEQACGPIDPVMPPVNGDDELDLVKAFVNDFRGWGRDFALQHNSAMANFRNRMRLVGQVWEEDVRALALALNTALPSIARAFGTSPDFCFYCDQEGYPFYGSDREKTWTRGDLNYRMHGSGTLDVIGAVGEVDVDVRIQLPTPEELLQTHALEVTAGRVSRENMSLVMARGSQIAVTFADSITIEELVWQRNDPSMSPPNPASLSLEGDFFVEAEYGITPGSLVDFEADSLPEWLDVGGWGLTDERALSGSYSLRSEPIDHGEATQMSAQIDTFGGYLTFNYAVESEANYDFFNLYVNDQRVLSNSGYQPGFKAAQVFLPPGTHNVVWEYRKDDSVSHNQDAVWIDNIQFPALASAGPGELVSQSILTGALSVTVHKLDEPWLLSDNNYLPGEILIDGVFANDFWSSGEVGHDHIEVNLAVNIANAADFVAPRPLVVNTLAQLGEYTVSDDLFSYTLPGWRIEISPTSEDNIYLYEVYQSGAVEPYESYQRVSERTQLHDVAGELIDNSGIGLNVVVPFEGLYLTTVLNASPWGTYPEGRFTASGGTVYGFLVEPFSPSETADQFVEIAVTMELGLEADELPKLHFGGSLTRHELNEGVSAFYLKLDGQRFNFVTNLWYEPVSVEGARASLDVVSPELRITNQEGVTLLLQFEDVRDVQEMVQGKRARRLEGELVYNGQTYGTLKLVRGATVIEYIDGTGETFQ